MRLAATVMVLRDAGGSIEVLMVRRSSASAFAPDAFVFPGGTVDPQDYDERPHAWHARLPREFRATVPSALPTSEAAVSERDAAALVRAAVREVREEASIAIEPDAIALFSHWITPPTEPRRYNTHFFVASVSSGVHGVADAIETHDAQWIAPARALERYARGDMHLVYPTIKHLERLTAFASTTAAMSYAREKPVLTIMPDRAPSEGFVMPSELEGVW